MDVSVVITCWNCRELLENNLPKVIKASQNPENHINEVMVVDDASTDESVDFVKNKYPQIKVITQSKNYGYSRTCNTGVSASKNPLVVILNADVVPSLDFLESSLRHFSDPKVFAVSFNEGKFGPGKIKWENGLIGMEGVMSTKTTAPSDWANGGSSVFRKDLWESLGGMSEIFLPFYWEDVDLGIRAGKRGYQCLWEPRSKVEHQHESTINSNSFDKNYIDLIKQRNQLILTWRNINTIGLFFSHIKGIVLKVLKHPGYVKVIFASFFRSLSIR